MTGFEPQISGSGSMAIPTPPQPLQQRILVAAKSKLKALPILPILRLAIDHDISLSQFQTPSSNNKIKLVQLVWLPSPNHWTQWDIGTWWHHTPTSCQSSRFSGSLSQQLPLSLWILFKLILLKSQSVLLSLTKATLAIIELIKPSFVHPNLYTKLVGKRHQE